MAIGTPLLFAFNRGLMSVLGLARTDLKRTTLSAEIMTNWMPRSLGSMSIRPGLGYKGETLNDLVCLPIPFVRSATDTAWIELTESNMRVFVSEAPVTRVSVSTAIANDTFSGAGSWTDNDESGAVSTVGGGAMILTGTSFNRAIRRQTVAVAGGDVNKEHAIRITVYHGPVVLKVGTADDTDDYIAETSLAKGNHSLAFTPTGAFHVQISNINTYPAQLTKCAIEAAGVMVIDCFTPLSTSIFPRIRWAQSADVIEMAIPGQCPMKIERRGTTSWSWVFYQPLDGPFRLPNTNAGITLTPSATTGSITITSSIPLFDANWVNTNSAGSVLLRLVSTGQDATGSLAGVNQTTTPDVKVTGLSSGSGRLITITITGVCTGTIDLQRSVGAPGSWTNVKHETWSSTGTFAVSTTYSDGLDNQIIFYRLNMSAYTSGTASAEIQFDSGSVSGIVRLIGLTSSTIVTAHVLSPLGGTDATSNWSEGEWSDRPSRLFPTAVSFHEGRLWWFGKTGIWGSVSDGYESFDETVVGDSGPINRTIAGPSTDSVNWGLSLQRLVAGTAAAENSIRSSSLDEPLTPTNFNIKEASTQGSSSAAAVKVDNDGYYINRTSRRLFKLALNWSNDTDYTSEDMTIIVPDLGIESSYVALAVQRQPDTRIHIPRSDGTVVVFILDAAEDVKCFVKVETDGDIENVFTLPGDPEDAVYYVVKRTINGSTKRYYERWATEDECIGGTVTKLADSFILYSGAPATAIGGLTTLEGESVVVWGDGIYQGTFTVSGGSITLPTAVSAAVVGLPYEAQFKSSKLAYAAQLGTALSQRKRVSHAALIMKDVHPLGITFGPDFDHLDPLPLIDDQGAEVDADAVWDQFDHDMMPWPGGWSVDSRICLFAQAPYPVTVCAVAFGIEVAEKA